jgi:hypothetical protein
MTTQKSHLNSTTSRVCHSQSKLPVQPKTSQSPNGYTPATPNAKPAQRERAERAEEWLLPQDRDCRSLAVREFDAHQDAAKLGHRQMLEAIMDVNYWPCVELSVWSLFFMWWWYQCENVFAQIMLFAKWSSLAFVCVYASIRNVSSELFTNVCGRYFPLIVSNHQLGF